LLGYTKAFFGAQSFNVYLARHRHPYTAT